MGMNKLSFIGCIYSENHYTAQVNSGSSFDCTIQPPIGQLYELSNVYLKADAPTGAGSGTHKITFIPNQVGYGHMIGISGFGAAIELKNIGWTSATSSATPTNSIDQISILNRFIATNQNTLVIRYNNDTDVNTTAVTDVQYFDFLFKVYNIGVDL